jgi:hypothetical protein
VRASDLLFIAGAFRSAFNFWKFTLSVGTNVDYAPTWLAMAGIPTPPSMDGRSILPMLIPEVRKRLF